jgi:hypothetical protein
MGILNGIDPELWNPAGAPGGGHLTRGSLQTGALAGWRWRPPRRPLPGSPSPLPFCPSLSPLPLCPSLSPTPTSNPPPKKPPEDPYLPAAYDADSVDAGKAAARAELRRRLGLSGWEDRLLVGVVSRLTGQKGVPLIKHAAWRSRERGAQFALLGSAPDPKIQVPEGGRGGGRLGWVGVSVAARGLGGKAASANAADERERWWLGAQLEAARPSTHTHPHPRTRPNPSPHPTSRTPSPPPRASLTRSRAS